MKKFSKLCSLLLTLTLVVTMLTACGSSDQDST
ncbi:MAG: hypothetical protein K0S04_3725, partial [Herbinix sp.]|nr:hypothetical protein [Herbinix sp.]